MPMLSILTHFLLHTASIHILHILTTPPYLPVSGVKGCLHSHAVGKMELVMAAIQPIKLDVTPTQEGQSGAPDEITKKKKDKKQDGEEDGTGPFLPLLSPAKDCCALTFVAGQLCGGAFTYLMRHVHPSNMTEVGINLFSS
jgi:hypothetical protein